MPLPERRAGEPREKFLERCMGDPVMVKDFADSKQRYAVCEKQAGPGDKAGAADAAPTRIHLTGSVEIKADP